MTKKAGIVGAAVALVVALASPARAVIATAVPGSFAAGWATPVILTPVGGPVTVVNADIAPHKLVADGIFLPKKRAKKTPWCKDGYPKKRCPLFWSEAVGTGQSTEVLGLERIKSGEEYPFKCEIHPNMTGVLVGL